MAKNLPHANKFWSSGQFLMLKQLRKKKSNGLKFTQNVTINSDAESFVFFVDFQEVIKFRPEFGGINPNHRTERKLS